MSPSLDPRGLRRLHDALAAHVDADALPGVAALVAAGDDVHVEVIGSSRFGGAPLGRDAIWRIASLTKPVVAAAALSMLADGTLALDRAGRRPPAGAGRSPRAPGDRRRARRHGAGGTADHRR